MGALDTVSIEDQVGQKLKCIIRKGIRDGEAYLTNKWDHFCHKMGWRPATRSFWEWFQPNLIFFFLFKNPIFITEDFVFVSCISFLCYENMITLVFVFMFLFFQGFHGLPSFFVKNYKNILIYNIDMLSLLMADFFFPYKYIAFFSSRRGSRPCLEEGEKRMGKRRS